MKHSGIDLAKRLGASMVREAVAIANGQSGVTEDEVMERMAACRSCEMYDDRQNRCNACGCFLNAKAFFRSAECDLGKWRKLG
jgi:hypothetical protein